MYETTVELFRKKNFFDCFFFHSSFLFPHQIISTSCQQIFGWTLKQLIGLYSATAVVITPLFIHHTIHQSYPFWVSPLTETTTTDIHRSPHCYISLCFCIISFYLSIFLCGSKDCQRQSIKHENVCHCHFSRSIIAINFTFWWLVDSVISPFNGIFTVEGTWKSL